VSFRYINFRNRLFVSHQMLHLTRAPYREQSPFACVLRFGSATPYRVIQAVDA
jgi:hypothetical protein